MAVLYRRHIKQRVPAPIRGKLADWRLVTDRSLRIVRADKFTTKLAGYQYTRDRKHIELEITYACNLKCIHCNRSCPQAPSGERMTVEQVRKFVQECLDHAVHWERIRLLGGEATLHPDLFAILDLLLQYRLQHSPGTEIAIATNGHGKKVNEVLSRLPAEVTVLNSAKESATDAEHIAFNEAPIDDSRYRHADFANGCRVLGFCGTALTPYGYYPCSVAGGIDRVLGLDVGRKTLPPPEDAMHDLLRIFCRYCGHFSHWRPAPQQTLSPHWERAYQHFRIAKPKLERY